MKRIAIIAGTAQTRLSLTPAAPCIKPLLLTAVLLQTLCSAAGLALRAAHSSARQSIPRRCPARRLRCRAATGRIWTRTETAS